MAVRIICLGKLKEVYFRDACAEYVKRLSRLMPVEICELPDESEPENSSDSIREGIIRREGERVLQKLSPQDYVIALCVEGKQLSSEKLADTLQTLFSDGRGRVAFVIGGSLGLSDAVKKRADMRLSVSEMTFPHQLFRVMLLEQLYRAAKINAGERYHK